MNISREIHRPREKSLGLLELVAIALGGMVGGGIFTILGISVAMIGVLTPVAIGLGAMIAGLAAYSYIKLGVYYQDEGATYSFFKKSFPRSTFAASLIGWWVIFGYISTVALYAYTFSSYAISQFDFGQTEWVRKAVACAVILLFALINVWSVKGMGKLEDIMVYTKLLILLVISAVLLHNGQTSIPDLSAQASLASPFAVVIVASLTFVAYEGFQLVINAVNEMDDPEKNIPRAIYLALALAALIYIVLALAAMMAIPFEEIIANQEYAMAAGAEKAIGPIGGLLVIVGALLATSSAISGTLFGASRQVAVIAHDGYFPTPLAKRTQQIPVAAVWAMAGTASFLVLAGSLQVILEFGSVTFLLVSLCMAYANHRHRDKTGSSAVLTVLSMMGLAIGTVFILYYELTTQPEQVLFIVGLYVALTIGAAIYSRRAQKT